MDEPQESALEFLVEPMSPGDILDVVRLEEESGLNSLGRAGFERQLARPGSILLVARSAGGLALVGSLSGWVIADEFQIDNIVVREAARRQGIAGSLMRSGFVAAAELGAEKAILEVRAANLPARRLYQRLGFELVGKRHEYYRDPPDDALIMICRDEDWDRLVA